MGDNPTLQRIMQLLRGRAMVMGLQSLYNPEHSKASVREHQKIVEAIRDRKPEKVEKLIRDHYLKAKKRFLRYLNSSL